MDPCRRKQIRWRTTLLQQCVLLLTYVIIILEAVPIDVDKTKVKEEEKDSATVENPDTGLYYDVYLRQVIEVLETDKHFREKLQTADIEEIKVSIVISKFSPQFCFLFGLLLDSGVDHQALLKQFGHLNHHNPHTFEVKDLDMLIKTATHDLENYDNDRHEEFKKYEMMKEHERREYLKTLDEEKRHQEEAKYEDLKKKHNDHPKVNHPVSSLFLPTL
ncbi:nucleobindin-2, partial [Protobothrops mucrosquamatus]|uniref:nucleobindin-2 n=1 Tax=Protobothrops mucrosquamatus TaxID=103944 RepID=UPI000775FD81